MSPATTRHVLRPRLASSLRDARLRAGWSARGLAREVGTVHSFVLAIEAGQRAPGKRVAVGLLRALALAPSARRELRKIAEQVEQGRAERAAKRKSSSRVR